MQRIAIATLALSLSALGCETKKSEPTTAPATGSGAAAQPNMTGGVTANPANKPVHASKPAAGGVTWKKPESWKDSGQRPMRLATFKVPAADGDTDDVEVSVSQAMGSVDANIQRWRGQFKDSPEAKTEDKEIAGIKTTLVEIAGTWVAGGGPMAPASAPKENWMMVVAMMHTKGQAHFFKMWGPKKTIEGARGDFDALLSSITQK